MFIHKQRECARKREKERERERERERDLKMSIRSGLERERDLREKNASHVMCPQGSMPYIWPEAGSSLQCSSLSTIASLSHIIFHNKDHSGLKPIKSHQTLPKDRTNQCLRAEVSVHDVRGALQAST